MLERACRQRLSGYRDGPEGSSGRIRHCPACTMHVGGSCPQGDCGAKVDWKYGILLRGGKSALLVDAAAFGDGHDARGDESVHGVLPDPWVAQRLRGGDSEPGLAAEQRRREVAGFAREAMPVLRRESHLRGTRGGTSIRKGAEGRDRTEGNRTFLCTTLSITSSVLRFFRLLQKGNRPVSSW